METNALKRGPVRSRGIERLHGRQKANPASSALRRFQKQIFRKQADGVPGFRAGWGRADEFYFRMESLNFMD
jgi:hypothetical protein